jgi:hypothetical protein
MRLGSKWIDIGDRLSHCLRLIGEVQADCEDLGIDDNRLDRIVSTGCVATDEMVPVKADGRGEDRGVRGRDAGWSQVAAGAALLAAETTEAQTTHRADHPERSNPASELPGIRSARTGDVDADMVTLRDPRQSVPAVRRLGSDPGAIASEPKRSEASGGWALEQRPSGVLAHRRGRPRSRAPKSAPAVLPEPLVAALAKSVEALLDSAASTREPLVRAHVQTSILQLLAVQVKAVTAARDVAIVEVFEDSPSASSSRVGPALGISRQRVDQLRRAARKGPVPPVPEASDPRRQG